MRQQRAVERALTAEDWEALHLVLELARQVCLHGRRALLPFAQAIVDAEKPR